MAGVPDAIDNTVARVFGGRGEGGSGAQRLIGPWSKCRRGEAHIPRNGRGVGARSRQPNAVGLANKFSDSNEALYNC